MENANPSSESAINNFIINTNHRNTNITTAARNGGQDLNNLHQISGMSEVELSDIL